MKLVRTYIFDDSNRSMKRHGMAWRGDGKREEMECRNNGYKI